MRIIDGECKCFYHHGVAVRREAAHRAALRRIALLPRRDIARRRGVTQQVVQKALYGVTRGGRPVGGALRRLREALAPLRGARP